MNRFDLTKQKVDDFVQPGTLRWQLWKIPDIDTTDFTRYTIKASDLKRLDRVAYEVYGDSSLWWVIALVNRVDNQLRDLQPGETLMIPSPDAIAKALAYQVTE